MFAKTKILFTSLRVLWLDNLLNSFIILRYLPLFMIWSRFEINFAELGIPSFFVLLLMYTN
jgi:hypothetical protein